MILIPDMIDDEISSFEILLFFLCSVIFGMLIALPITLAYYFVLGL